ERVRNEPNLELVGEPAWTNVCFRHVPEGVPHLGETIDAHNAALRAALLEEGKFMVSRADLDQRVVLRSVIANPAVEASTLDDLVDHVLRLARTLPVDAGSQVEEPRT
ncbi:MAG: hypothetical protein VX306_03880, partial [Candidatus Thermoplasmatota archaeon]|nr:hypothetical protein [Candidatus Thermoplasmatota archaeon]